MSQPTTIIIDDYDLAKKIIIKAIENSIFTGSVSNNHEHMKKAAEQIMFQVVEARNNGVSSEAAQEVYDTWRGGPEEQEPGEVTVHSVATTRNNVKVSVIKKTVHVSRDDGTHQRVKIEINLDEWPSINKFVGQIGGVGDSETIDHIKTVLYRRDEVPGYTAEDALAVIADLIGKAQ